MAQQPASVADHGIRLHCFQHRQDTADVASWGADFVKLDWCRFNETSADPPVSERNMTTAFGEALRETGRNIFFNFHCGQTT